MGRTLTLDEYIAEMQLLRQEVGGETEIWTYSDHVGSFIPRGYSGSATQLVQVEDPWTGEPAYGDVKDYRTEAEKERITGVPFTVVTV